MKRLPRLSRSGVLTPSQWESVAKVIEDNFREVTIQPGVGYTVTNSSGGSSLKITGKGLFKRKLPFDLVKGSDESGASAVNVTPGIVAGFLPDNIFDAISYSSGDLYIWAECTASDGSIFSVTLNSGATTPTPQEINEGFPPSSLNIPIGMIQGETGKSFNFIGANWLTPYPVVAYSIKDASGYIKNYYIWKW
jgi:hypothetical protein